MSGHNGGRSPAQSRPVSELQDIVLSANGSHLYASAMDGILHFRRDAAGALAQAGPPGQAGALGGLALTGGHLVSTVQHGYASVFPVDAATGALGDPKGATDPPMTCGIGECRFASSGWLAPEPSGGLYLADGRNAIVRARVVDGALERERAYANGAEGIWDLVRPFALAVAPGGGHVYAVTDHGSTAGFAGGIVTFRRDGAGGLAFAGAIRPAASGLELDRGLPKDERIVVAGGARFVNDRMVEVLTAPQPRLLRGMSTVSSLRISVDGVHGPVQRLHRDGRYLVELPAAGGRHRIGVSYTRPPWDYGLPLTWEGSVVLDRRRPVVRRARLARADGAFALRVRARDDRSGVRRVQLAARRSRPARAVRFRTRVRVRRAKAARWVRVHDRAGNASAWQRVRRAG